MCLLRGLLASIAFVLVYCSECAALSFEDANQLILASHKVMQQTIEMPERTIPKDLLKRSRGVAIFPNATKVGLLFAVSYGRGIVLRKNEATHQWSKPVFFKIRGGSFGPQLGVQSIDLILLVMSEAGIQGLLEDKFTLGADISIAAGPIGRDASAETNLRFNMGILSYSRAKGFFAGISVKGAVLEQDKEANEAYYGAEISAQDIFYEDKGVSSDNAELLSQTLGKALN